MKKITAVILMLTLLLPLCSCGRSIGCEKSIFAMDTVITITFTETTGKESELIEGCKDIITKTEKVFSRTDTGSEIYRFNSSESTMTLSDECAALVREALRIYNKTGGAYDATVAPVTDLWQIHGGEGYLPTEGELSEALLLVGSDKLTLVGNTLTKSDKGVALDLGGIAKGYALEKVCDYLTEKGVSGAIVNFGGNVGTVGKKKDGSVWNIGIKSPANDGSLLGSVASENGYIAVSGDYERYFELDGVRYHHIFDPNSGYPVRGLSSVAVYCSDGALGDALSTALFVMGADKAYELYKSGVYEFEALFTDADGKITMTDGMKSIFKPVG